MSVLILDAGNSIIKAKVASGENGEAVFAHAIQPLSESEYQKIQLRLSATSKSKDYIRVNGKPYVVGESAERHGVLVQRFSTARYKQDYYYGVLAAVLARSYEHGSICLCQPRIELVVAKYCLGETYNGLKISLVINNFIIHRNKKTQAVLEKI